MKPIVKTAWLAGLSVLVLAADVSASGAEDMAKILDYRQNIMKTNGAQAADIGMILKGEVPFGAANVVAHAEVIHALSKLIPDAFPKGSGAAAGKTRAKDEIGQSGMTSRRTPRRSRLRAPSWSRSPRPAT